MAQTSSTLRARHACADPGFQRFHELLVRDRRRYPKEFWILPAMRRDDLSKHPESTGRTRAAPGRRVLTGVGSAHGLRPGNSWVKSGGPVGGGLIPPFGALHSDARLSLSRR